MPDNKGFTLLELLVVVLIIGILTAIALPQYQIAVEKSRMSEARTTLSVIAEANKRHFLATGEYAAELNKLDVDIPGEDYPFGGQIRRKTQYFVYTAIPRDGNPPDAIALAQRVPMVTYYYLYASKSGQFVCIPYSSRGTDACKWFNSSN